MKNCNLILDSTKGLINMTKQKLLQTIAATFNMTISEDGLMIRATNGPITVAYEITDTGWQFLSSFSNVKRTWDALPTLSLMVARWHRGLSHD